MIGDEKVDKFSYEENGYNRKEVNQFVVDVIKETETIVKKYKEQKQRIARLEEKLATYEKMEDTLKHSLIQAEKTGDNIKRLAREESESIVSEAKNNASRIVNEALLKAEKINNDADLLERNVKIFKRKLKIIVEQQLAVVEEIETLDLKD